MIDLTGGEVKVVGNRDDEHTFRLSNPEGQDLIESDGIYEAEFLSQTSGCTSIDLDLSEIVDGVLILPVTISSGVYRVRRLNPRRTLLTMEVDDEYD